MRFFKKKQKAEELVMEDHKWSVGETTMNDRPFYIRFNTSISSDSYKTKFPIKVGFAIQFNEQNELGLPTESEVRELDNIEDTIIELIHKKGVQALVLTTGGIREFIFYVEPNVDIASIHQVLLRDIKSHEVQCMAVQESDWETYSEYTPS